VNGFAVFIGRQIGAEIYWRAANHTGYFWEEVAFHKRLLRRVKTSIDPGGKRSLSNTDRLGICHFSKTVYPYHTPINFEAFLPQAESICE
jgi:hypothetical protein